MCKNEKTELEMQGIIDDMTGQIGAWAIALPPQLRDRVRESTGDIAAGAWGAAKQRYRQILERSHALWPTLTAEERAPWEAKNREALRDYEQAFAKYGDGHGPEPKRPLAPFFIWMRDKVSSEWNEPLVKG